MKKVLFGNINGQDVYEYTLDNGVIQVGILTYGGTIRSINLPNKNGGYTDIALGYDTLEEYLSNGGYIGALIGRVANRIYQGKFTLNGVEYQVGVNDGCNSLHGGFNGFDKKIWKDTVEGNSLVLRCESFDMEEGYPGNLKVTVVYTLTSDNALDIEYFAECDKDCPVSLTNHVYFNLNGAGNDVLNTQLSILADSITPVNEDFVPVGNYLQVENTPFDFNTPKEIGKDINCDNKVLKICGGYDVNYVTRGSGFRKISTAYSPLTGITLETYTDQPGVQLYTGNFLDGINGKNGAKYNKNHAFCLETQGFPNAVNCPQYPSIILKNGEKLYSKTTYKFR